VVEKLLLEERESVDQLGWVLLATREKVSNRHFLVDGTTVDRLHKV
jgi:hypothetical protein